MRKNTKQWDIRKIQYLWTSRASRYLKAAIYLQDEVSTKIADLEKESVAFDADLYWSSI